MYYIYRIDVNEYFYYGSSKDKYRISKHKYRCYIENSNFKLYKKIRELELSFDNLTLNKIHENLTIEEKKRLENKYLRENKDNPLSLNDNTRIQLEGMTRKELNMFYNREYRIKNNDKIKSKIPCNKCGKCISKYKIKRHQQSRNCK